MSVRREDKDGAERWWKSLFCHGQKPALAQGSPCEAHTIPVKKLRCRLTLAVDSPSQGRNK